MSKGTPLRSIRVPNELWAEAMVKADRDGTTVTAVLVEALRTFAGQASTSAQSVQTDMPCATSSSPHSPQTTGTP